MMTVRLRLTLGYYESYTLSCTDSFDRTSLISSGRTRHDFRFSAAITGSLIYSAHANYNYIFTRTVFRPTMTLESSVVIVWVWHSSILHGVQNVLRFDRNLAACLELNIPLFRSSQRWLKSMVAGEIIIKNSQWLDFRLFVTRRIIALIDITIVIIDRHNSIVRVQQ